MRSSTTAPRYDDNASVQTMDEILDGRSGTVAALTTINAVRDGRRGSFDAWALCGHEAFAPLGRRSSAPPAVYLSVAGQAR